MSEPAQICAPSGEGDLFPPDLLKLAQDLAWPERTAPAEGAAAQLPALLKRPDCVNPVGELDWREAKSEDAWPRWYVRGSPIMLLAAQRLFDGLWSDERRRVSFPAMAGNFEDLLMLLHRHPLTMTDAAAAAFEASYAEALRPRAIVEVAEQPALFKGRLLPFQREGVAFLAANRRCLLADDMGLGKTVMAFGFLARIAQWPAVIVAQSHVQKHWERKLPEFLEACDVASELFLRHPDDAQAAAPGALRFAVLNGANPEAGAPQADIYIVHYLVLWAWVPMLIRRGVRVVVFDECQELRHRGTRKHDSCVALSRAAENAVGLSGTPIYNHGTEIYTVLDSLARGCLGPPKDFYETWCGQIAGKFVVTAPAELGQYLRDRHLMLRRRKDDVALELPPKRRVVEPIDASRETFAELVREAVKLARDAAEIENPFDRARMEQEAIRETRRATALAKLPAVIAFLRGLMEAGEPTLVFVYHHAVIDKLMEEFGELNVGAITGMQDKTAKEASRDRFINGDTNLLLISLRAATGIDGLQARARCVVFAELDWSPAIHRQAEDRAHRMGQQNAIIAYYLITDLGTDPGMMLTLNLKESQFTGLMHDPRESDDDRAQAELAAKEHMGNVLKMLRGGGE